MSAPAASIAMSRFEHPTDVDDDAIDAAYRGKYCRYASGYVDPMVGGSARATTLRVVPT